MLQPPLPTPAPDPDQDKQAADVLAAGKQCGPAVILDAYQRLTITVKQHNCVYSHNKVM